METNLNGNVINSVDNDETGWIDPVLAMGSDVCEDEPCGPVPVPYPPDETTP